MDGRQLLMLILAALDRQESDLPLLHERRLYDSLETAIAIFIHRTTILRDSITITTVAGQDTYALPASFIRPVVHAGRNSPPALRYTTSDGSDSQLVAKATDAAIFRQTPSGLPAIPACWTIIRHPGTTSTLTATATGNGPNAGGASALIADNLTQFLPRDFVRNVTRRADGIVIGSPVSGQLPTAMFPRGQASWRSGDQFVVRSAAREQLQLSTPAVADGDTITLPSLVLPLPVYHDHGHLPLSPESCMAIAGYAAWLFAQTKGITASATLPTLFAEEIKQTRITRAQTVLHNGG